jgi:hypothetical protein
MNQQRIKLQILISRAENDKILTNNLKIWYFKKSETIAALSEKNFEELCDNLIRTFKKEMFNKIDLNKNCTIQKNLFDNKNYFY